MNMSKTILVLDNKGCFKCPIQNCLMWRSESGIVTRLDCALVNNYGKPSVDFIYTDRHPNCPIIESAGSSGAMEVLKLLGSQWIYFHENHIDTDDMMELKELNPDWWEEIEFALLRAHADHAKAVKYDEIMDADASEAMKIVDSPSCIIKTNDYIDSKKHNIVRNALLRAEQDRKELEQKNHDISSLEDLINGQNNTFDLLSKELAELKAKVVELSVKIILGEYLEENEYSYSVVDECPSFVNEKRKQKASVQTELFEDEEYVIQTSGACGDDYYGKIARKFRGKEQWVVIDYAC